MAQAKRGEIRLKRVYDRPAREDGERILVERLWPRGLSKDKARVDLWLKDIAPSTELRQWYGHEPEKWPEFQRRYRAELRTHAELLRELQARRRVGPITLVFAARDQARNSAVVLKRVLEAQD